jgi:hypothetical protein
MVLAEKVSEQVVTMTAPEMIVEAAGVSRRSIILWDYVTFWP